MSCNSSLPRNKLVRLKACSWQGIYTNSNAYGVSKHYCLLNRAGKRALKLFHFISK